MAQHDSQPDDAHGRTGPRRARAVVVWAGIVVLLGAVTVIVWQRAAAAPEIKASSPPPVAVTVTDVKTSDVPIYLEGLGTVQASETVAVRPQLDGTLVSLNFKQGDEVRKGDTLAQLDPRPLQAALDQAKARKVEDQAQLIAAQKDLERFKKLAARDFETQQNVDQQQGKVDQLTATIAADQAAIESATTQLSYTTITAPIDGRSGFLQVDAGNIVHVNDTSPITTLTKTHPSYVNFTLPEKYLADVREAMLRGTVSVIAYDQNKTHRLDDGKLMLIDNQIDQATGTIHLKATFDNTDDKLWPGAFVDVKLLVQTRNNAVTIPFPAIQRGPDGAFVWVIRDDGTAEQRPIDVGAHEGDVAIVNKGLTLGERIVTDGQYRLSPGARVTASLATPIKSADTTP